MLPLSLAPLIDLSALLHFLFGLVPIDICIYIRVSVYVDVDISTVPVGVTPCITPCRSHCDARTERYHRGSHIPWRVIVVRRIGRVWPGAINDGWIVGGNVNNLGIRRFNLDDLFLDNDFLFFVRFEMAGRLCLYPKALDGIQNFFLVRQESIAEFLCPVELVTHH